MSVYQEQRCTANPYYSLEGCNSFFDTNEHCYDFANGFSIYDRNIIRKLSKQYRIISIEQQEDIYFENRFERIIVQEKPFIIKYENWDSKNRENPFYRTFEWEFYPKY